MTKREQKIVLDAVNDIMDDDGDFSKGIDSLLKLCGGRYPAYLIRKEIEFVSFAEIAKRGNSKFSVTNKI
jgi:hypothetical protein